MVVEFIVPACTCKVKHTVLQGSLTTQAAAYPKGLCDNIAELVKIYGPSTPGPWLPYDSKGAANNCEVSTSPSMSVASTAVLPRSSLTRRARRFV